MTEIISKYGAFAVREDVPASVYGEYLAHYAILTHLYNENRTEPYEPSKHKIGYYPRELNKEVERGYRDVLKDVKPYLDASSATLADLAVKRKTD